MSDDVLLFSCCVIFMQMSLCYEIFTFFNNLQDIIFFWRIITFRDVYVVCG